jgi:putative ABC transport system permease protein
VTDLHPNPESGVEPAMWATPAPPPPTPGGSASRPRFVETLIEAFALAAGVAAIISALAVGHSAAKLSKGPTEGLNRDVVIVSGTAPSASGVQAGLAPSSLTPDDVTALGNAGYVPNATAVAPTAGVNASVTAVDRTVRTDVIGSTSSFSGILGYQIANGRFLSPSDVQLGTPAIVLGQTVVQALFPGTNPVGQSVTIDSQTFQVVGAFTPQAFSGTYNPNNLAVIPITTAWNVLLPNQKTPVDQVLIRAASPKGAAGAAKEATTLLMQRHGIVDPALADFTVVQQPQLVKAKVQEALLVRRLLELGGAVLLLAGALHLAIYRRYRLEEAANAGDGDPDWLVLLARTLSVGLVAVGAGIVAALILAPVVHHLAPGAPSAQVTIYGVFIGAASGVAAAAVSLIPQLVHPTRPHDGATPTTSQANLPGP